MSIGLIKGVDADRQKVSFVCRHGHVYDGFVGKDWRASRGGFAQSSR
jgi:hypothetical protein